MICFIPHFVVKWRVQREIGFIYADINRRLAKVFSPQTAQAHRENEFLSKVSVGRVARQRITSARGQMYYQVIKPAQNIQEGVSHV